MKIPIPIQLVSLYFGYFSLQTFFFIPVKYLQTGVGSTVELLIKSIMYFGVFLLVLNSKSKKTKTIISVLLALTLFTKITACYQMYRLKLGTEVLRINNAFTGVFIAIILALYFFIPSVKSYYANEDEENNDSKENTLNPPPVGSEI